LLGSLRGLGIPDDLAARLQDVIGRRNRLVHHVLEDAVVLEALIAGNIDQVVDDIDALAADCQRLINDIAPVAFADAETALGAPLEHIVDIVNGIDPGTVVDERLRTQLAVVGLLGRDELAALLGRNKDRGSSYGRCRP
jgi:hypothetical protein